MAIQNLTNEDFPLEFQEELIGMVKRIVPSFGIRFSLVHPRFDSKGFFSYNVDWKTEELYRKHYAHLDPLRPSRHEDTDLVLVCSDTMLSHEEWAGSVFFREFMQPQHFEHNIDVFFRKGGKIIAVLSLMRNDEMGEFCEAEADLLRRLQPFMEYALNNVYLPQRFAEREYFSNKYLLTERELDVMEILMAGADTKTMADELNLSIATIKTHLQHIFGKTGVRSTKELISRMYQELNT